MTSVLMINIKKAFIIAGLIISGGIVSAQTHYSSNVSLGGHAGMEMSQVFFNPSVKQSLKMGATAGVSIRYIEEKYFGLIGEINFAQRGWKNNFEEHPYQYSRTLNYIEIAVMAHIYFGRRGRFFFNAGPQIGFCIGESHSSNFDVNCISSIEGFPTNSRTDVIFTLPAKNKIDYGICAGLGGEFSINKRNSVYLEGRFYYGLGNIFSAKRTDPMRASNQMAITATLGYWFRIK